MLKLAPELTEKQRFEQETFQKWKEYELPQKPILPIPQGERYIDIGCGSQLWDELSNREFWALDVVPKKLNAKFVQGCFPHTTLPDSYFDVVFCIDLIAELPSNLYRLAISELARILKPEGKLVLSSEIDTQTVGACQRLRSLVQTEFVIELEQPKYKNVLQKLLFRESCHHLILVASRKGIGI